LLGPANPAFVPIVELPEHVVRAVTTSEDAGFFAHRGFDFDELKNALLAGVKAGKLQRGGSTISQQLAKNLFLSRDRTLARKAREALVTVALEGTVPKARLLEIYLNLIEWGPGIYGIGPAARHYLDKDARAMTPREACFLATLIPSPRRSHAALEAGVPVQRWDERIDDLLGKLLVTGVLDEETVTRERAATLTLASWVPRAASSGPAAGEAPPESDEPGPTGAADDPAAGGGPRRGVDPSPRTGPSGPGAP
jgi:membrane peptidoglycan carboxypeptidase